jgi:Cys-tRNA(Pro)/Cys-tRNA(Cys) deacylase
MESPSPVSKILTARGIPHQQFTHSGPIHSLEQAAAERNQTIYQIIRSILFRLSDGEYAMVLVAGPYQVSWKALRTHFNQSRLTMASPEEVLQVTGYELGAVSPFGIPPEIPILMDEAVLSQPSVSLGSGVRGTTILLTTENLLKALGEIQTGKFAQK